MNQTRGNQLMRCLLIILIIAAITLQCSAIIALPFWWDEGWSSAVARNWVEFRHWGQIIDGANLGPGLSANFEVILPVMTSFKLFGISIQAARYPMLLYGILMQVAFCALTAKLFDLRTAIIASATLIAFVGSWQINPWLLSVQVLGDIPMMFFLFTALLLLAVALERSWGWALIAGAFWALAWDTKIQVRPFALVFFVTFILLALISRQRRARNISLITTATTLGMVQTIVTLRAFFARGGPPSQMVPGLLHVTGFVTGWPARTESFRVIITYALPALCGYSWFLAVSVAKGAWRGSTLDLIKISLCVMGCAWFLWFAALSSGWARYVMPPVIVGHIFLANTLLQLLDGSANSRSIFNNIHPKRFLLRIGPTAAAQLCIITVLAANCFRTLKDYSAYFAQNRIAETIRTAEYIGKAIAPNQLLETYESELLPFVSCRVHVPPDSLHVDIDRQSLYADDRPLTYDPLAHEPDLLVVGPFARSAHLYEPSISSGAFTLTAKIGRYDLYRRQRGA